MKSCVSRARLAVLSLALAAAFPAFSQSGTTFQLKETVITATRSATRTDELVSEVVVVDRKAIETSTARTLPELLARTAGVQLSANGGTGKNSGVFIRGTESRHTILLIDGVRYGSATLGTPVWDNIPVDMIERIEVLKGPASALYGSEGVGGVVQIFTRKGKAGFHPYASATVGSETRRETASGFTGGQGAFSYALGAQVLREKGFSATNSRVQFGNFNPDRDGFKQDALNGSLAFEVNKDWKLDGGFLYSDGETQFDDGPGRDTRTAIRTQTMHAGVQGKLLPNWQTELRYSQGTDTSNAIVSAFLPGDFKTQQDQWAWLNHVDTPIGVLLAGAEHRTQKVSSSTVYAVKERTIDAVFTGINGNRGDHSWQLNMRRDRNSQFGSSNTGFAGYGYRIAPAWRVHASHGTSFVSPSFNQLYFPGFGNPLLQPERGRNTDLGVTWAANDHEVKLVRFDNKIRGFITSATTPANVPRARIDGWTLGYGGKFGKLSLRAAHDALDARNELNGRLLPRRAKRQTSLGADYDFGAWRAGASVLNVGSRFDDAANTRALPAYTTVDLYTDYQLAKDWSLQAKLNNLTDKQYETAFGFNQPGRGAFVTLRWQPK